MLRGEVRVEVRKTRGKEGRGREKSWEESGSKKKGGPSMEVKKMRWGGEKGWGVGGLGRQSRAFAHLAHSPSRPNSSLGARLAFHSSL